MTYLLKENVFLLLIVSVCVCVHVHVGAACGGQERVSDLLEQEFDPLKLS